MSTQLVAHSSLCFGSEKLSPQFLIFFGGGRFGHSGRVRIKRSILVKSGRSLLPLNRPLSQHLRSSKFPVPLCRPGGKGSHTSHYFVPCVKGPIHGQTNLRNSVLYKKILCPYTLRCLRKIQSLGKCRNENISKAACLAIILAYAMEEETVYRKMKGSIWTKDWLKRRSVFGHGNIIQ